MPEQVACPTCGRSSDAFALICAGCGGSIPADAASVSTAEAAPALAPGTRLGRFVVGERLGAGSMGVVYAAHDEELDRPVAVKMVAADRLLDEARALARVNHPNVVTVFDAGRHGSGVFVAMERVDGITLEAWLAAERRAPAAIVELFVQAGRGLAAVHRAGLVHRDFKASNVMIGNDGRARVLDFGLARLAPTPVGETDLRASRATTVAGTPAYMAPEVRAGGRADARSDQFSYCTGLGEALGPAVPARAIARALDRGRAPDPEARFADMEELLRALAPARRRWWPVAAALVALGGAGAFYLGGSRPAADPCAGIAGLVAGVWGPARRVPDVAAVVDPWSQDWLARRTRVCRASLLEHSLPPEQAELQARCYARRLSELDALLRALPAGKKGSLSADGLPRLDPCEDVEQLARVAPPPVAMRARAEQLQLGLDQVRAMHVLGRYQEGRALAERLTKDARVLGHAPLTAEALLRLGSLQFKTGQFALAEQTLEEAIVAAEVGAADDMRADALYSLVWAAGTGLHQYAEAHAYAALARAAFQRLKGRPFAAIGVDEAEAILYSDEGNGPAAIALLERAVEARRKQGPAGRMQLATTMSNLSYALSNVQRYAEAIKLDEEAAQIMEATMGPRHPALARILSNLGADLVSVGRRAEGRRMLERALALQREVLPPGHENIAYTSGSLGEVCFDLDDLAASRAHYTEAIDVFAKNFGLDTSESASAQAGLGQVLLRQGERAKAIEWLERAIVAHQKGPVRRASLASTRFALARALWDEPRRRAEARPLAHEALAGMVAEHDERAAAIERWLAEHR